jgi:hypothetical protein
MLNKKSLPLIFLAFFFLFSIVGLNLALAPETHAHPPYGFTPQPPPPPSDGGGSDDDGDTSPPDNGGIDNDDKPPTDFVIVQIERCDLSCSVDYDLAGGEDYQPIAAVDTGDPSFPLLVPKPNPVSTVQVLAQVQLIHQGSGWIAQGVLSDANSTRLALPYPGRWEVFLISQPEFMTGDPLDPSNLNLNQLQTQLADGPVSLGTVEANVTEVQWVKCPIACVVDPPPVLPETGGDQTPASLLLFIGSALVWLLGFQGYRTWRSAQSS